MRDVTNSVESQSCPPKTEEEDAKSTPEKKKPISEWHRRMAYRRRKIVVECWEMVRDTHIQDLTVEQYRGVVLKGFKDLADPPC